MSRPLELRGQVAHRFVVPHPPEVAYRHFAGNEALLKAFLGADAVTALGDMRFRVRLERLGALGVHFSPELTVRFTEVPPDTVEMASEGARMADASHDDLGFDSDFRGSARFLPHGDGHCQVRCEAETRVRLVPPGVLKLVPVGVLKPACEAVMGPALKALAFGLEPVLKHSLKAAGAV